MPSEKVGGDAIGVPESLGTPDGSDGVSSKEFLAEVRDRGVAHEDETVAFPWPACGDGCHGGSRLPPIWAVPASSKA